MIVVLGKFRIDVIETGLFSLDGGAMFVAGMSTVLEPPVNDLC